MTSDKLADDLLRGAAAIGGYLNWDERQVYHAAAKQYLPISHCGAILIARKSELDAATSRKDWQPPPKRPPRKRRRSR